MSEPERQTRSHLREVFARRGLHPRHDLGQNFLIDLNLIELIVADAALGPNDVVLEVGAGTGGMTAFLAQQAGAVVSVEIDPRMYELARTATAAQPNVTLLNTDALRGKNRLAPEVLQAVEQQLKAAAERRLKLVANLPYNVATPVVANLVATDLPWERMVITIQKELGRRMAAAPRTADYSALSVWLQAQCRVSVVRVLGPTVFWPRPKVDSAVVLIEPDEAARAAINDRAFFREFVQRLFQQRRKLLRRVLVEACGRRLPKTRTDAILQELGLGEQARAEELDPSTLVTLSNRVLATLRQPEDTTE